MSRPTRVRPLQRDPDDGRGHERAKAEMRGELRWYRENVNPFVLFWMKGFFDLKACSWWLTQTKENN